MELMSPDTGLILWAVLGLLSIGLFLAALIRLLLTKYMDSNTKLIWTLIILLVPTIGPILFFAMGRKGGNEKVVS